MDWNRDLAVIRQLTNRILIEMLRHLSSGSYWPSLLIKPPTMVPWTTWQACLAKGISFLICKVGAADKKEPTKHELSHNVKVRKNNLACEIPISYATVITGCSRDRRLLWVSPSTGRIQSRATVDTEGLTPTGRQWGVKNQAAESHESGT